MQKGHAPAKCKKQNLTKRNEDNIQSKAVHIVTNNSV